MILSDTALIEKVNKGSKKAFEELYDQYWELLFDAAFQRLKSKDLAKDVVQELFIDLWNRKGKIQVKQSLKVYLLTAVKYNVFKVMDQINLEESLNGHEGIVMLPSDDILPFEALYEQLEDALEDFPEMAGKIFRMNKLQGMSASEVSKELGINIQSVHNSVHKSMKLLKESLRFSSGFILFL
ncbi:sigma-70 family RNA polymerase sigma factor [Belliella sp. R4-6]|uniref:Sigma-70 family RNA polymerase sigma factor n=1 Tax=Belliella alkalica TaxID=1730871 RepID=A0ABS9V6I0_9BACT|nr:sigma-70 family RNA polymerase sigma factor [Belliella alkalica]MCH7412019.1 sigma-70 family RNA polymerase sigma factor [Belliella alkalica]